MIRAVLEGCGYGLRQLIDIAEQTTGQPISEFVSLGGGAKSETWAQIKSDIIGKNINVMELNDATPVGAALLAGVGCGLFRNVAEASAKLERKIFKRIVYHDESQSVYKARFRVYTELYPRLKDLFTV
jgi:xylulokinase